MSWYKENAPTSTRANAANYHILVVLLENAAKLCGDYNSPFPLVASRMDEFIFSGGWVIYRVEAGNMYLKKRFILCVMRYKKTDKSYLKVPEILIISVQNLCVYVCTKITSEPIWFSFTM